MCKLVVCIKTDGCKQAFLYCYMTTASHKCRKVQVCVYVCVCGGGSGRNRDKRADVKQKVGAAACEELI